MKKNTLQIVVTLVAALFLSALFFTTGCTPGRQSSGSVADSMTQRLAPKTSKDPCKDNKDSKECTQKQ